MTISDENRARFESLGTAEVRHELGVGYVRHLSGEQRVQAQDWLAEQDASFKDATIEAKRRETRQFILGIIVGALAQHIVTLRRLHARVLEAEFELLRRAHGESLVEEALRLADEAARQASRAPQELPPEGDERASEIAEALNRMMDLR